MSLSHMFACREVLFLELCPFNSLYEFLPQILVIRQLWLQFCVFVYVIWVNTGRKDESLYVEELCRILGVYRIRLIFLALD